MERPDVIRINAHPVRVHQWSIGSNGIVVTALVTGDAAGKALLTALQTAEATVAWDGFPSTVACIQVNRHHSSGDGPRSVHRVQFTMESDDFPRPIQTLTDAEKLDVLLEQVRTLKLEIKKLQIRVEALEHDSEAAASD